MKTIKQLLREIDKRRLAQRVCKGDTLDGFFERVKFTLREEIPVIFVRGKQDDFFSKWAERDFDPNNYDLLGFYNSKTDHTHYFYYPINELDMVINLHPSLK